MDARHYLCSELVTLKHGTSESMLNLEEIWREGAFLEAESAIAAGEAIELRCGETIVAGVVAGAEEHEFGWRIEVAFSEANPWSPEWFRPQHLLDPWDIKALPR